MKPHVHVWRPTKKAGECESCSCGLRRLVNCQGVETVWKPKIVPDYDYCGECNHRRRLSSFTDESRPGWLFHAHVDTGRKGEEGFPIVRCVCGDEYERLSLARHMQKIYNQGFLAMDSAFRTIVGLTDAVIEGE